VKCEWMDGMKERKEVRTSEEALFMAVYVLFS
jgi:hypothetical protein